jgi:hypothetical protein
VNRRSPRRTDRARHCPLRPGRRPAGGRGRQRGPARRRRPAAHRGERSHGGTCGGRDAPSRGARHALHETTLTTQPSPPVPDGLLSPASVSGGSRRTAQPGKCLRRFPASCPARQPCGAVPGDLPGPATVPGGSRRTAQTAAIRLQSPTGPTGWMVHPRWLDILGCRRIVAGRPVVRLGFAAGAGARKCLAASGTCG